MAPYGNQLCRLSVDSLAFTSPTNGIHLHSEDNALWKSWRQGICSFIWKVKVVSDTQKWLRSFACWFVRFGNTSKHQKQKHKMVTWTIVHKSPHRHRHRMCDWLSARFDRTRSLKPMCICTIRACGVLEQWACSVLCMRRPVVVRPMVLSTRPYRHIGQFASAYRKQAQTVDTLLKFHPQSARSENRA